MDIRLNKNPQWTPELLALFQLNQVGYAPSWSDEETREDMTSITAGGPSVTIPAKYYEIDVDGQHIGDIMLNQSESDKQLYNFALNMHTRGYAKKAIIKFVNEYLEKGSTLEALIRKDHPNRDKIFYILYETGFEYSEMLPEGLLYSLEK